MREIKFRIADTSSSDILDRGSSNLSMLYDCYDGCEDIIWLEYTGLKDKNGVEIYEGDIVQFGTGKSVIEFGKHNHVSHGHGEVGETLVYGFLIGSSFGTHNKPKVIGNIFENPDLI